MQATFAGAANSAVDEAVLSPYPRLPNRQVRTVAMSHRVLKRDDRRWETALNPWTLPDELFDECLAFFKCHLRIT
jgi:hypothetical protein